MSIAWGWPIGLLALSALLLPVLLHLDRRRTLQTLRFAALRWIGERQRPRRSWRLIELVLLALRLLLLAAIALWLAQPLLRGAAREPQHWLAVVPGVDASEIARLQRDGQHVVWLAPDFPQVDAAKPAESGHISSLLRELDSTLSPNDDLTVLLPSELSGLDARAIELTRDVSWEIASTAPAAATSPAPAERALAVRYADPDSPSLAIVRAAAKAWEASAAFPVALDEAPVSQPIAEQVDAVIWLGGEPDGAAMKAVESGATLLQMSGDAETDVDIDIAPAAATRVGRGKLLQLSLPGDPRQNAAFLDAEFPARLHEALFGAGSMPSRARAQDVRPATIAAQEQQRESPLRPHLVWLIAALFLIERLVASGRRLARGA
jgi:hypothetical protein